MLTTGILYFYKEAYSYLQICRFFIVLYLLSKLTSAVHFGHFFYIVCEMKFLLLDKKKRSCVVRLVCPSVCLSVTPKHCLKDFIDFAKWQRAILHVCWAMSFFTFLQTGSLFYMLVENNAAHKLNQVANFRKFINGN